MDMEIKTIISEVTHEDLVDLFSTALTGSYWLGCDYDLSDYRKLENPDEKDCIEDVLAKLLLAGKSIVLYDKYAEDEEDFYGDLWHTWDGENKTMDYVVTLKDIKKGLQKCLDGTFRKNEGYDNEVTYIRSCMNDFMNKDSSFDECEAENLMQIILFGKMIYG